MNVLVYGWYNHGNIGDELFKLAFNNLFPDFNFTFTNLINNVDGYDAIFIGGGSLLDGKPRFVNINQIKTKPIFYIGIGTETSIHPIHQDLMANAKLIASRSPNFPNSIYIPDLVYSLNQSSINKQSNKILFLPNIATIPNHLDPLWKYNSWNYFKIEMAQFLDYLIENKYEINIGAMCQNQTMNDFWAGNEIVNLMVKRKNYNINLSNDYNELIDQLKQYSLIISQRYHGNILAQNAGVAHISLYHHDKLKNDYFNKGKYISYYGLNKKMLIDALHFDSYIINPDFTELKQKVYYEMGRN